jgi:hypothetical protein
MLVADATASGLSVAMVVFYSLPFQISTSKISKTGEGESFHVFYFSGMKPLQNGLPNPIATCLSIKL